MHYLPLFLDVRNRLCVVIGGGAVAVRKVRLLRRAEARVRVVAPELDATLVRMAADGELEHLSRRFIEADLDGSTLVVAATNPPTVFPSSSITVKT